MARISDFEGDWAQHFLDMPMPSYESTPWVQPPPLAESRVAIVSTAGIHRRSDPEFELDAADYRLIPGDIQAADLRTNPLLFTVPVDVDPPLGAVCEGFQGHAVNRVDRGAFARGHDSDNSVAGQRIAAFGHMHRNSRGQATDRDRIFAFRMLRAPPAHSE